MDGMKTVLHLQMSEQTLKSRGGGRNYGLCTALGLLPIFRLF